VGTYSSIFIASPILVLWQEWLGARMKNKIPPESTKAVAKKVRPGKV